MLRRTLLIVLLLAILVGVPAGVYGYAVYQWRTGQQELTNGNAVDARARFQFCLRIWRSDSELHRLAARAARLDGDLAACEEHLNHCLKIEGGGTQAIQLEFLLLRVQMGEVEKVERALKDLVERGHPESVLILETIARAYMHTLQYGPAYGVLTDWIALKPDQAKPYHWRGWVLERMDKSRGAELDYKRALERDDDLVLVRLRLGEMLMTDSKGEEALPYLERCRKDHPDRSDVKARLGQCYVLLDRWEEARVLMEDAVKEMPEDSALLLSLARLEQYEKRHDAAEKWLRALLKADPADTEAMYLLVPVLRALNRPEEAARMLTQYEKTDAILRRANKLLQSEAERPTTDATAAAKIGASLLELNQIRVGVYWLQQALKRDPRCQLAHRKLADFYEQKGDTAQATIHRQALFQSSLGKPTP